MSWDDFARYYEWEFDLLCTEQAQDVNEWLKLADEYGDPILELACGAGRITLPLADQGYNITALDSSRNMLHRLNQKIKPSHKLKIVRADMRKFHLGARFRFIFISYASFQLLLTMEDQLLCLDRIRDHLQPGGILGLDISTRVCEGPD
ncbi:MAG: class I SAM-dependent methyltransferase, partial [Candidatus Cloacimonetes bacterium]|nr:class I SAM-dependent methyltransferase [Candidatus Cloacimonadota bacterium]